jgi:hypothetical protein
MGTLISRLHDQLVGDIRGKPGDGADGRVVCHVVNVITEAETVALCMSVLGINDKMGNAKNQDMRLHTVSWTRIGQSPNLLPTFFQPYSLIMKP